jgi:hypothetical protein
MVLGASTAALSIRRPEREPDRCRVVEAFPWMDERLVTS